MTTRELCGMLDAARLAEVERERDEARELVSVAVGATTDLSVAVEYAIYAIKHDYPATAGDLTAAMQKADAACDEQRATIEAWRNGGAK